LDKSIYLINVTDSQSKSTLRTESHEFGYNCAMKVVYKDNCSAATEGDLAATVEGDMTNEDREKGSERQPATQTTAVKRSRPLAGFFIAGASLALLFGLAALKGRVKDDNTDSERGLD
jgi:hypothetical protein